MEETVTDPLIGRIVDGRYRVVARLARGGMARVYRAVDERLDRDVALKVMHGHLADNEVFLSRFQREARSAARLSHPAVVSVFDQGVDGDTVYLAMELVEGKTVRELLNERRVLSIDEAAAILEPVLAALGAAHRAGIIHRDVKPENILLGEDGTVKVADFGLARAVSDATSTSTNTVMGTVAYLSPELLSRGIADARSDIYAVGVLLHEMLSGTQPHVGETPIQVAYQHVHEDIPSVALKAPWLGTQIDGLITQLAARDPDDRPADGEAALAAVLEVKNAIPAEQRSYVPTEDELQAALVAGALATDALTAGVTQNSDSSEVDSGETVALSTPQTSRLPAAAPPPPPDADKSRRKKESRKTKRASRESKKAEGKNRARAAGLPNSSSKKRPWVWVTVVISLLLLLAGGTWWYLFHGPGSYTMVPNVVGAPATSASKVLAEHELDSKQTEVFDDEVPAGDVISTDPKPESNVKKETTIELIVSKGPEHFEIPDIIDVPADEAVAKLEKDGLSVTVSEDQPWHEKIAAGNIIAVDPEPGTEVTRRDEITLTVSAGREPIDVPLTVNMTRKDAVAALEGADLTVKIKEKHSDTLAENHVLSQEPSSGTLYRGNEVVITVSLGPEKIEVPNVLGRHVDEAKKELSALGFKVETRQMNDWWVWGERVSDQKPRPGKKLKKGETVTLTLS